MSIHQPLTTIPDIRMVFAVEQPLQPLLKTKKSRRKHKNSKLGCVQCKERRMKCNQTLPECRNCKIRQERIPCSYLSFTPEQKTEFLHKKALQDSSNTTPTGLDLTSPSDVSSSSPSCFEIKLVKHVKPTALESQHLIFFNEPQASIQSRLYYTRILNQSFVPQESEFASHLTFSAFWLHLQLSKKLKFLSENNRLTEQEIIKKEIELNRLKKSGMSHKADILSYLGKVICKIIEDQGKNDIRSAMNTFTQTSSPTICLKSADILLQDTLRFFFVNGTISVLNELYSGIHDSSPVANFIAKSVLTLHRSLFTPNYPYEIFQEITEFVLDLKPFVDNTKDIFLIGRFKELISFLENSIINSTLKSHYDPDSIFAYPPNLVYSVFHKFYDIMPSEMFTINTSASSIHKLVYSIYYSIARVLDNVFPENRYTTQYRFIGPTNIYPYDPIEVVQSLSGELRIYGIYFTRILAFFSRRSEFFNKYMRILNPFPENLSEHRFDSRKVKINEECLDRFKNAKIKRKNYPQVIDKDIASLSLEPNDHDDSFATNFNTLFSLHLNFQSDFSRVGSFQDSPPNQNDNVLESYRILKTGLLECDYDPLDQDWTGQPHVEPIISFNKFNEDRAILLKHFINNEAS